MRVSQFLSLFVLAASATSQPDAPQQHVSQYRSIDTLARRQLDEGKDAKEKPKPKKDWKNDGDEPTIFNGKRVPKMIDLKGDKIDEMLKQGNWLVEFFSPYCGHCLHFKPTWDTLYEYYYTSEPLPQTTGSGDPQSDPNSFTNFYDFKFARVNCVEEGDACVKKGVGSWPTIIMYKNGEEVKKSVGGIKLSEASTLVEAQLESIKPGSRPPGGVKLPKVGAHEAEKMVMPVAPAKSADGGAAPDPINAIGKSIALTAENFQRLVTTTRDPWFVKFYAPWCHHCQAMAPSWQAMARSMKGKLNIGEVNCETEKRLCKDVKVRAYPTLLFFRGGERIEYDGLRGLGDLTNFAQNTLAVAEGIPDVTAAEFEELEKKEEVIFLYVYDQATTSEDFKALDRLVMSLIGRAKLVKTSDKLLAERFKISTWPRLLVSRDGKPTYYTGLSPQDMRDYRRVLGWMRTVWLPIVPELTASNAKEIMQGKLVVLGILSRDRSEEFVSAKREIKNAALEWIDKQTQAFRLERQELRDAKQLRIEEAEDRNDQRALRAAKSIRINMDEIERKAVGFAWVDGVFWDRWTRTTFGMSVSHDKERVVMYDYDNHRYWDVTMTGNPIVPSRTSILETLPRVVANPPKLAPKRTMSPLGHVWWVLKSQAFEHPLLSVGLAGLAAIVLTIVFKKYIRVPSSGYFRVGEKGGPMDGLLGGNSGTAQGGKVD